MFYALTIDSRDNGEYSVVDYFLGSFKYSLLWSGTKLNNMLPSDIKLLVNQSEQPISPDYIANPISWHICSKKLLDSISIVDNTSYQIFNAPIINSTTKKEITGYYILNPTRLIKCICHEKSKIKYDKNNEIDFVFEMAIHKSMIPNNVHIFRAKEFPDMTIVSEQFADALDDKKILGVSLIKIKTC